MKIFCALMMIGGDFEFGVYGFFNNSLSWGEERSWRDLWFHSRGERTIPIHTRRNARLFSSVSHIPIIVRCWFFTTFILLTLHFHFQWKLLLFSTWTESQSRARWISTIEINQHKLFLSPADRYHQQQQHLTHFSRESQKWEISSRSRVSCAFHYVALRCKKSAVGTFQTLVVDNVATCALIVAFVVIVHDPLHRYTLISSNKFCIIVKYISPQQLQLDWSFSSAVTSHFTSNARQHIQPNDSWFLQKLAHCFTIAQRSEVIKFSLLCIIESDTRSFDYAISREEDQFHSQ